MKEVKQKRKAKGTAQPLKKGKETKPEAGFWASQLGALKDSFRAVPERRFWHAAVYDLLFCIAVVLVIMLTSSFMVRIGESVSPELQTLESMDVPPLDSQEYIDMMGRLKSALFSVFAAALGAFALALVLGSVFTAKAWSVANSWKFTRRYYLRILMFNLAWSIIWLLLFFIIASAFNQVIAPFIFLVEMALFVLADQVLRTVYDDRIRVDRLFSKGLGLLFRNFHRFIAYWLVMFIMSLVLLTLIGWALALNWLFWALSVISLMFLMGFSRVYVSRLVGLAK